MSALGQNKTAGHFSSPYIGELMQSIMTPLYKEAFSLSILEVGSVECFL
jgi:hypothetical protein